MSQEPARRYSRIPFHGRARVRGSDGGFDARIEDISVSGVRLRVDGAALKLDLAAGLGPAAACIRSRIGARFVIELGAELGGARISKSVDLRRLALPDAKPPMLDLGCSFEHPLNDSEIAALNLGKPGPAAEPPPVRHQTGWTASGGESETPERSAEDQAVLDALSFGDEETDQAVLPRRPLKALVTADAGGAQPLLGEPQWVTQRAILVRLDRRRMEAACGSARDVPSVILNLGRLYGNWPHLEVVDGFQRLWRGAAYVCGVEVDDGGEENDEGVMVRFAFGRQLQASDVERICAAA